jgi:putative spermidine/putrescine transport system substrate-binding protein
MKKTFALLLSLILIGSVFLAGCGSDSAGSDSSNGGGSDKPQKITIYTVAGGDEYYNDILIPMFEEEMGGKYEVEYGRGTPQEIISKIKAQGDNGNIDLVITGLDGLPMGIEEGLWEQMVPNYNEEIHQGDWNEIANAYIETFDGYGVPITTGSGGPILVYNEDKVKNPPTTYEELKEWIDENPGKFLYPAVSSSGPARGFFLGLAQAMGEDFNNPDSLDKTWKYLEDISGTISNYPTKTSDSFTALYDGSVDIIPHYPFWFANLQVSGTVPPNIKAVKMTDSKQIIDSHFFVMLKDLPEERKQAALDFLNFAMSKEAQAQGLGVAFLPANGQATADLLKPEYQENYKKLTETILPDYLEGETLKVAEDDWVLFPSLETANTLYKQWEEKIQSK